MTALGLPLESDAEPAAETHAAQGGCTGGADAGAVGAAGAQQPQQPPGWHADTRELLCRCYGEAGFASLAAALLQPPSSTCVRVNTLLAEPDAVRATLAELSGGAPVAAAHPDLPEALLVQGSGAQSVDLSLAQGREVAVSRRCAEAVMRGADVYVPGVLGCTGGIEFGMVVAITAVIEPLGASSPGMTRGKILGRFSGAPERLLLGLGRAQLSRAQMCRSTEGVAVSLLHGVFEQRVSGAALSARLRGHVMLQNLPSIVAARALSPAPGSRVLDMCASPGGKTAALAALMRNTGEIIALDVNAGKVAQIRELCSDMGVTIVSAHKMDSTKAVQLPDAPAEALPSSGNDHGRAAGAAKLEHRRQRKQAGAALSGRAAQPEAPEEPPTAPFPPESFDYILLDAPCSALGLRPRLLQPVTLRDLTRHAALQRALMHAAVALLRPGGALVFSTCSINPLENEANVGWALATFPCLTLAPHAPRLGSPGLTRPHTGDETWLTDAQAALVQRFAPDRGDTIGFFVARFEKRRSEQ